jgi:hypothetical protein
MSKQKLPEVVALRAREFVADLPIARSTLYGLPPEVAPHQIRIGGARVFTETPADWLKRLAAAQAADKGGRP